MVKLAQASDQQTVVSILAAAFKDNPSINFIVKNDAKRQKRIEALCLYAFKTGLKRKGVYLSSNEKGAAIFFKNSEAKETFSDYSNQLSLVKHAIGLKNLPNVMKRDKLFKSTKPKDSDFIYIWFLGVAPGSQDGEAARELRDFMFDQSNKLHLPLYLETSVPKNKTVYQRLGFEVYKTVDYKNHGTIFFMRKFPH